MSEPLKGKEWNNGLVFAVEPEEWQTEIEFVVRVKTKKKAFAPIVYCRPEEDICDLLATETKFTIEDALSGGNLEHSKWESIEVKVVEHQQERDIAQYIR